MLTRKLLESDEFARTYSTLEKMFLTPEQLNCSLQETLKRCPVTQDVWIFGYGSLIWNPLLDFAEAQTGRLNGWSRDFNIRLLAGRGSACAPGRMLGLKAGGETCGIVFRLDADKVQQELRLLWMREMLAGVYNPCWCNVQLADGRSVWAITFVTNPSHPLYEADTTCGVVAGMIAGACGALGSNAEYLFSLEQALIRLDIEDPMIGELAEYVRLIQNDGQAIKQDG